MLVVLSTGLYALISAAINGQPSTKHFDGWVAILASSTSSAARHDQVHLEAEAVEPGAPGEHPALVYSVAVCGNEPFHGVLLMGGDARLTGLTSAPATTSSEVVVGNQGPPSHPHALTDLVFDDLQSGGRVHLYPVDALKVDLVRMPPCVAPPAASTEDAPFAGAAVTISGRAQAPIEHVWRVGPFSSPRTSTSWPIVGSLPFVSIVDRGVFRGVQGLSGDYVIPIRLSVRIGSGSLAPNAVVEEARPSPTDASSLDWAESGGVQATARVADATALSELQQWQLLLAILFGVSASILGALVLDFVRSRPSGRVVVPPAMPQSPRALADQPRESRSWLVTIAVGVLILRSWRRNPDRGGQ